MSDITKAIQALCDEKGLTYEAVMETIEAALAAAYRKDFGNKQQNIKVKFDPATGNMQAWDVKTVVEDIAEDVLEKAQEELAVRRERAREAGLELTEEETVDLPRFNPKTEMMITQAKEAKKGAKVGDILEIVLEIPHEFGRMAAQTAKQVIIQKIREAERTVVFGDFKGQEGTLILGTVQRVEGRKVLVDLGKITGVMPSDQMIFNEHYRPGARMKFFVAKVEMTARGPEIILSRAAPEMVREVFKQEIPEVASGVIEIKGVARDAGFRSKVAVATDDSSIDPIGSCIGQRGSRINTIIEELGGEKIDVIQYNDDAAGYIAHALSPAKAVSVDLNDVEKTATVTVAPEQFSIAIGRSGQNVRLASELTGWRINVAQLGGEAVPVAEDVATGGEAPASEEPERAPKSE
ncbi:MAG: Transcription elongation factor NusA [Candidatus Kaiserbacteria bacterium GW2011_GWA2_49_19]|uniref:Transcription termination/antitermination protein NusA n=1 Tax=Candidatus Kaiserbacteria bacterium GW2011_GWA2_49_19 TaxID=1618669 RepID=A0A0G1VSQ2_9BACT|nr:MAG: Transcription elongation factor NusA [Candidatus Kaiserbacteria bacterium GW2011_GWA2_49_19]